MERWSCARGSRSAKRTCSQLEEAGVAYVPVADEDFNGAVALDPVVNPATGEMLADVNEPVPPEMLSKIRAAGIERVVVFSPKMTLWARCCTKP